MVAATGPVPARLKPARIFLERQDCGDGLSKPRGTRCYDCDQEFVRASQQRDASRLNPGLCRRENPSRHSRAFSRDQTRAHPRIKPSCRSQRTGSYLRHQRPVGRPRLSRRRCARPVAPARTLDPGARRCRGSGAAGQGRAGLERLPALPGSPSAARARRQRRHPTSVRAPGRDHAGNGIHRHPRKSRPRESQISNLKSQIRLPSPGRRGVRREHS